MFDSDQQWITATLALIGQGEGNEARIMAIKLTKYRADMRCVAVDVRHHHDHIARTQIRVGTEAREQLVMQDFHFALSAVGNVKTDRLVLCQIDSRPVLASFVEWTQLEDVVLQLIEQVVWLSFAEQVDTAIAKSRAIAVGIVVAVEQVDVVPALLAPRSQQWMGVLMQRFRVQHYGHSGLARLPLVLMPQQIFVGDDIGPMVTARVVYTQQNLAETRKPGQRFKRLGWQ